MFCKKSLLLVTALVFSQAHLSLHADESERWISADVSLANSVGIGTFYSRQTSSQWTTSLSVSPTVALPLPASWPKINIDAELSASVWWLNSLDTGVYDINNRIQFPDLLFWISAPQIFSFKDAGISFSATIPIVVPISATSRALSRLASVGFGAGVSWKHALGFGVSFSPQVKAWIHSGKSKSISCAESASSELGARLLNPQAIDSEVDQYMMALSLESDDEGENTCMISGRQNTWSLKLPLGVSFKTQSHQVGVGVSYYWNFLRPLEYRPDLASERSSGGSFTQVVLAKAAYTYKLPLSFDLALSGGIINYQSVFSKTGNLTFPLFDFETPNKNQTQIFVEMTASL